MSSQKYLQETTVLKSIWARNSLFPELIEISTGDYRFEIDFSLKLWTNCFPELIEISTCMILQFWKRFEFETACPPPPKSVSKLQPKKTGLFIACRGRVGCGGWRHLIFNRLIQFFFQSFFQTSFSSPGIRFNSLLNKKCWDGCLARWQAGSNIF